MRQGTVLCLTDTGFPPELIRALEQFDETLGVLRSKLREDDLLIVTADHGNDPTWSGTDHTREMVPFLAWSPAMRESRRLPDQQSFAVIGATIADNFGIPLPDGCIGESLLGEI